MRAIIQRSGKASVKIGGKIHGKINGGLVVLLGITNSDTEKEIEYLIEKITNLRLFQKDDKNFEESLLETKKQALVISQFTLYANCGKGRRPDFNEAAKQDIAKPLYEKFIEKFKKKGIDVQSGEFGAMMNVSLINQGPITIILESGPSEARSS